MRSQGSDERVRRVRSANSRAHRNAPLTPEGRLRLCLRIDAGRPIAHVAAEAGLSRRCPAKWYARWPAHGENGLLDHSSRPATSPGRTAEDIAVLGVGSPPLARRRHRRALSRWLTGVG
ncbi:leucine zipper domain-containing protein [Streptomyces sp. NPDC057582]|uniref:leucine zipper domain-containing protein n=1 Tax=Streptomyces sp. NPDC057582 TaxID=3346174 RepID=UPI003685C84D